MVFRPRSPRRMAASTHSVVTASNSSRLTGRQACRTAFIERMMLDARVYPVGEEGVGAHPGEQVEQHLGETHARAFLGDDGMAAQGRLEAAAQRLALHDGDAVNPVLVEPREVECDLDAQARVLEHASAVAGADQVREQRQVTAQVEDVGVRGEHEVVDTRVGACVGGESPTQRFLRAPHLLQQALREAGMVGRRTARMHVHPVAGLRGIAGHSQQGGGLGGKREVDDGHGRHSSEGNGGRGRPKGGPNVHPCPPGPVSRGAQFQAGVFADSRSSRRRILPTFDFGSSSRNSTNFGSL